MKALQVTYERLVSTGYPKFSNERVGITLLVEDGEKADAVLEKAKQWVNEKLGAEPDAIPF